MRERYPTMKVTENSSETQTISGLRIERNSCGEHFFTNESIDVHYSEIERIQIILDELTMPDELDCSPRSKGAAIAGGAVYFLVTMLLGGLLVGIVGL